MAPQRIPGFSTRGPSLAVHAGSLFAAWKGAGRDDRLWYSWIQFDDPGSWASRKWADQVELGNARGRAAPGLASHGGKLWATWAKPPLDATVEISWNEAPDAIGPSGWWPPMWIPGIGSAIGPSMASWRAYDRNRSNPSLFLVLSWLGLPGDVRAWWIGARDVPLNQPAIGEPRPGSGSGAWGQQQTLPHAGTDSGAQLAASEQRGLFAAWNGVPGDDTMWWCRAPFMEKIQTVLTNWTDQQQIKPTTGPAPRSEYAPSIAVDERRGRLIAIWKDWGLGRVSYSFLPLNAVVGINPPPDGNEWTAPLILPDVETADRPALIRYADAWFLAWKDVATEELWWRRVPELD